MLKLLHQWFKGDHARADLRLGTVLPRTARLNLETLEQRAPAATLYALGTTFPSSGFPSDPSTSPSPTQTILRFDTANPNQILGSVPIQGLNANELIVGIDFRPRTGQMFGLGRVFVFDPNESSTVTFRLLTINPLTGVTRQIGSPTFDFLSAGDYAFDFNPRLDVIRVVDGFNNAVLNPNNGEATLATEIPSSSQFINNAAFDRNFDGGPGNPSTSYAIEVFGQQLQTLGGINQNPSPNTGQLFDVGSLGVSFGINNTGFDVRTSGQMAGAGFAFAVLDAGDFFAPNSGLYSIDLSSGQATYLGAVGDGTTALTGLAAVPDSTLATGITGGTTDSTVNIINAFDNQVLRTITPFGGFNGNLSVGMDDVNRDAIPDVIVGAQAPNGHVKAFDGLTGAELFSLFAFEGFNGSVSVASGDVNGDGFHDLIATANGANAHVKAFSGADGSELVSFFAFEGFSGSASVGAADFNNDGTDEIIVGTGGQGIDGRFAIFSSSGSMINAGAMAFTGFNGATSVAGGDIDGDGIPDIVIGAADGGDGLPNKQDDDGDGFSDSLTPFASAPGGHVKVFSGATVFGGTLTELASFFAYDQTYTGGVSVGVADHDQDGRFEIQAAPMGAGQTEVRAFDGLTLQQLNAFQAVSVNLGVSVAGARGFNGLPTALPAVLPPAPSPPISLEPSLPPVGDFFPGPGGFDPPFDPGDVG